MQRARRKRLRAPINDDIRHVFNRMLSTPGARDAVAPEARVNADARFSA
jgi:hypothetical protein